MEGESQFFIASTTKLYTTALVLQLAEAKRLSLDDPITAHLPPALTQKLHVFRGRDASDQITIRHLLSHRSGLADYFSAPRSGSSLEKELLTGQDRKWDVQQATAWARELGAAFPPGQGRKALYSDTNYQLLGAVIEQCSGDSFEEALRQRILLPLGLNDTWLFQAAGKKEVTPLRAGARQLHIPLAMQSFGPDGGIVSTARELLIFLRAFFEGQLLDQRRLPPLEDFRRIMFPLQYGVGIMRFALPWIFAPFGKVPTFLGHSGLSGAFAFYCPEKQIYLAGTVNQIENPATAFQLLTRIASAF